MPTSSKAVKPSKQCSCHGISGSPNTLSANSPISVARDWLPTCVVVSSLGWYRPVRAGSGWFPKNIGIRACGGFACVCKKTGSANPCGVRVLARCFCCAYCWPRHALHGLQAGTRLLMSLVPPLSVGSRWSASVAWFMPHQWHTALPLSSTLSRLCLNSFWLRCLLLLVVAIAHAPTACASAAQAPCSRSCW